MGRELNGYRDNLELLNNRFPAHDLLTLDQLREITGWKDSRTIKKHLGKYMVGECVSKVFVARMMCGKGST